MIETKYEFKDVFYSDLDDQIEEENRFNAFLLSDNQSPILYVSIIEKEKKISGITCCRNVGFKKYIFIETSLAGIGINHFIIKSKYEDICAELESFFKNMTLKDYYSDKWIVDLLKLDIDKLYKTDCDGGFVMVYEN